MKKLKNSLRFRLILVVTLLTASMSILHFWLIYGLLRWEEDFVFEQLLRQQLEFIEYFPENPIALSPLFKNFTTDSEEWDAIKDKIQREGPNLYELDEPESLMILVGIPNTHGVSQVITARTDAFEYVERNSSFILFVCAITFLLSFAISLLFGAYLVARIVRPLRLLAKRLSERIPGAVNQPLAPDFNRDEIGLVADAYDGLQTRLYSAMEREKKFSAEASHELRTPLAIAFNAIELIRNSRKNFQPDAPAVMRIERSLKRMQKLIETFLILGRAPEKHAEKEFLRLDSLIEDALHRHQEAYSGGPIKIERNYPENFHLFGEPEPYQILIQNTIVNAAVHAPGEIVKISVFDQGTTLEFRNKIVNHCPDISKTYKSTGLGLEIVSRITDRLGIGLEYGSETDEFFVRFVGLR